MISILIGGVIAFATAMGVAPLVIAFFRGRGLSQSIRDDVLVDHSHKQGTPTMGGAAIVAAIALGFVVAHVTELTFTPAGLLLLFVLLGMAVIGAIDDVIKIRSKRSGGLSKRGKVIGQATIAVVFAVLGPAVADIPSNISVVGAVEFGVPTWVFAIWVFLLISGFSNGVNLTDGADGLAAGATILVMGAYVLIGFWMFRNPGDYPNTGGPEALEVAVIAATCLAGCAGFLWFNAPPARIMMGDVGSLAMGGLVAAMAIITGTQLLLVVIGGLYVLEALSVMAQVFSFRVFKRRILLMAPFHHHFEVKGMPDTRLVVRIWILSGLATAIGLGIFYAEWIERVGVTSGP